MFLFNHQKDKSDMYNGKMVAVVVPAYNEEKLIDRVVTTMPEFVDKIVIVDDSSKDQTADRVQLLSIAYPERLILIEHAINRGVGAAIATGYKWCRDNNMDVTVVMAGDAQMDPEDLPALLNPVVKDETDYTKGNRLISGEAWRKIPHLRYLGNATLSLLTKIASGYWHIADSQTGYTAANLKVLKTIDLDHIYNRYGMPNDLLVKLNIYNFRVRDVEIKPIYGIGEKSGIRPIRIIPRLSWLIFKLFLFRMVQKYVIRDFHPLIFFYLLSGFILGIALPILSLRMIYIWISAGQIPPINALAVMVLLITGLQFLLFAMWFDMDYNRDLR
jgi:glycosyltransferase involved in cell wall biosynthesis